MYRLATKTSRRIAGSAILTGFVRSTPISCFGSTIKDTRSAPKLGFGWWQVGLSSRNHSGRDYSSSMSTLNSSNNDAQTDGSNEELDAVKHSAGEVGQAVATERASMLQRYPELEDPKTREEVSQHFLNWCRQFNIPKGKRQWVDMKRRDLGDKKHQQFVLKSMAAYILNTMPATKEALETWKTKFMECDKDTQQFLTNEEIRTEREAALKRHPDLKKVQVCRKVKKELGKTQNLLFELRRMRELPEGEQLEKKVAPLLKLLDAQALSDSTCKRGNYQARQSKRERCIQLLGRAEAAKGDS